MFAFLRRLIALIILLSVAAVWLYAGTLFWRVEQLQNTVSSLDPQLDESAITGAAALIQARYFLSQAQYISTQVERLLQQALRERPLYAPAWLDLAELARRNGQMQDAVRYLEYARTLWPQRPVFLWRVALLLAGLGQTKPALDTLALYWAAVPRDGLQVIALARRLQPEHTAWVDHLLAAVNTNAIEPQMHYRQLLSVARKLHDVALAQAVWRQLPESLRQDSSLLYPYIGLLLAEGYYNEAGAAWSALTGQAGGVYNGGFEQPLANGGLGWRYRDQPGVRIERDRQERYSGDYSLLINFTGSENVNFAGFRQWLIVDAGKRYRLQGYWKGYDVTTRSGVYIELVSAHTANPLRVAVEPKYGTWSWDRFELLLEVPADVRLLELRVRRRATTALDNMIAGKVWLDDFIIEAEQSAE